MIPLLPFVAHRIDPRTVEQQVDDMVGAYLEAACWTEELEDGAWSAEAKAFARFECLAFLYLAKWNIQSWPMTQLGHDFWLTRNGHGAGFWDRDIGTEGARNQLTRLAHVFGTADAYLGDDGQLYF